MPIDRRARADPREPLRPGRVYAQPLVDDGLQVWQLQRGRGSDVRDGGVALAYLGLELAVGVRGLQEVVGYGCEERGCGFAAGDAVVLF